MFITLYELEVAIVMAATDSTVSDDVVLGAQPHRSSRAVGADMIGQLICLKLVDPIIVELIRLRRCLRSYSPLRSLVDIAERVA